MILSVVLDSLRVVVSVRGNGFTLQTCFHYAVWFHFDSMFLLFHLVSLGVVVSVVVILVSLLECVSVKPHGSFFLLQPLRIVEVRRRDEMHMTAVFNHPRLRRLRSGVHGPANVLVMRKEQFHGVSFRPCV